MSFWFKEIKYLLFKLNSVECSGFYLVLKGLQIDFNQIWLIVVLFTWVWQKYLKLHRSYWLPKTTLKPCKLLSPVHIVRNPYIIWKPTSPQPALQATPPSLGTTNIFQWVISQPHSHIVFHYFAIPYQIDILLTFFIWEKVHSLSRSRSLCCSAPVPFYSSTQNVDVSSDPLGCCRPFIVFSIEIIVKMSRKTLGKGIRKRPGFQIHFWYWFTPVKMLQWNWG